MRQGETFGDVQNSLVRDDSMGDNAPSSLLRIRLQSRVLTWGWTDRSPYEYDNFNANVLFEDGFVHAWSSTKGGQASNDPPGSYELPFVRGGGNLRQRMEIGVSRQWPRPMLRWKAGIRTRRGAIHDIFPISPLEHLVGVREERRRMAAQTYIVSLLLLVCSQWSSVDGQCGGNFTEPTGNISSPNYPDEYPNNAFCVYEINVEPDNGIELTFVDFQLEGCPSDTVEVFHPSSGLTEIFCRGSHPTCPILELSNSLVVTFQSDDSITYRGFLAEYLSFPQSCDISAGWLFHGGQCYFYVDEPKTALEAQQDCQGIEGNLVSIHNDEENAFIGGIARNAPLWLGLQRQGSTWEWLDGTPFDYDNVNPNFLFDDEYAIMWKDEWGNDDCGESKPFVCRLRADECPDSTWRQEGLDCFLVVRDSLPFASAVSYCENTSPPSTLLTVPDDANYQYLVAFVLNGLEPDDDTDFWIGIERQGSTWSWIDDTASELANWAPGYPLEDSGKDCATITLSSWDDFPGYFAFPFVCKKVLSRRPN
ncbi:unnamed protein product [Darwinula stevensoni]|uniref:Uncharacterized protein n=1 Tax=Darwinula stevensoni TaxID=69355 RepID=A0A7R9FNQ3_9CRUS|nr:unnamed protein product [Darwinula stevensoni]CAG0896971.1 unnamed protein product [Darwinula stevensoni]